ncbi:MAG: efflux RND transporter permease subunit [Planctomycetes bacterium]|nr:efflux RND transporter permease subunit [Planctomycetota bacterium]
MSLTPSGSVTIVYPHRPKTHTRRFPGTLSNTLLAALLAVLGAYSYLNVNVEAYPDPAPAIIEVVAQKAGASAEWMEQQVTIPIEVALSGMPGLGYCRSKSQFGLSHLRNQFDYGVPYEQARQEVFNRLSQVDLPEGMRPVVVPASPIGEIFRYTLSSPRDEKGQDIYTLQDLKSLQDALEREFRRVPRVGGVGTCGGKIKRYEVHPDPRLMQLKGVTLEQLQKALADSNLSTSGGYRRQGDTVQVVRGLAYLGGGQDPLDKVMRLKDPREAASILRAEDAQRVRQIRNIVIACINNQPICVDQVVDGGSLEASRDEPGKRGVVIGYQPRLGQIGISRRALDADGNEITTPDGSTVWNDADDKVQAVILLRKGQESLPALRDVQAKIKELNETPGKLLPGVKIEPYYNRSRLIGLTTETVTENLVVGLALVTVILLMFLSNVRTAVIVAINIPLALLFAFSSLYLRGRSANLLSIGAVDFGIIVDSTVIVVENIYRNLSSGRDASLSAREKVLRAASEVQRSLLFATLIMVVALLPLFTMKGPEGQIFGPMADTYAWALLGALLLALTVSPVLCVLLLTNLKAARDNFVVRSIKRFYLWQLDGFLSRRWLPVGMFAGVTLATVAALPLLGREFMPELEEGNIWIRAVFAINSTMEEVVSKANKFRALLTQNNKYPEIQAVVTQVGRPDDGTDQGGFYNLESFVPLRDEADWPVIPALGRQRTKKELVNEINAELEEKLPGLDWAFSQYIRDNVMEVISGVKGENSLKIFGGDLDELERLAREANQRLSAVRGVSNPSILRIKGQSNLELAPDDEKCRAWGIRPADVVLLVETALAGKTCSRVIEGEKRFDLTLRFPYPLRCDLEAIRDLPVEILNNTVTPASVASLPHTPRTGGTTSGVSSTGTSSAMPSAIGALLNPSLAHLHTVPHRRLGDLMLPVNSRGVADPNGTFIRPGASTIAREQGQRFIAVKFAVRDRDLASTVAEAQVKVNPIIPPSYRVEWGGEFEEMQQAEHRLLIAVSVSLAAIFILLYIALRSWLDALVVYSNVAVMTFGGVWALLITGTHFNISACVGFISILGVAVMNGLLQVSCPYGEPRSALAVPRRCRAGAARVGFGRSGLGSGWGWRGGSRSRSGRGGLGLGGLPAVGE